MRLLSATQLADFAATLLRAHGAREEDARDVADFLVRASLAGHESHGVFRVGKYIDKIRSGELVPAARPALIRQRGAIAVVSGNFGFGHLAARHAARIAANLADQHGIAGVTLSQTTHIGRLGDYAQEIAEAGSIALLMAGGAARGGSVAPFGGRERIFGTNPIAWGLPVPEGRPPLVADFSTSEIPEGKVAVARANGQPLPHNVMLDSRGRPSTDPGDFYAGGTLLPFGGHKGSSLMLLVEVVANLLAGAAPVSAAGYQVGNPTFIIAVSIGSFIERADYLRHIGELLGRIESSEPAEPGSRVCLPNALEHASTVRQLRDGIPVPNEAWKELQTLAHEAGIEPLSGDN